MCPDPRSITEAGETAGWTLIERGSFVFGRCDLCGFHSPGRRARYSVESDMCAHTVLCHSSEVVGDVSDVVRGRAEAEPAIEAVG
jgi:hypothetical protein